MYFYGALQKSLRLYQYKIEGSPLMILPFDMLFNIEQCSKGVKVQDCAAKCATQFLRGASRDPPSQLQDSHH